MDKEEGRKEGEGKEDWVGPMGGFQILYLVVGRKIATTWQDNWFTGLLFDVFYTIRRA